MIYYVLFFTILLFAVLLDVFKTKQLNTYEKQIFVLLSFFLILMSGLRLKTGYDFESYKQILYLYLAKKLISKVILSIFLLYLFLFF